LLSTTGTLSPAWDNGAKAATTTLAAGTAQIVYATASAEVASCFGNSPSGVETRTDLPVSISGNALTTTVPLQGGQQPCGKITYTLLDACCRSTVVSVSLFVDSEGGSVLSRECPDGG
jgi:hypothetical protein